MRKNKVLIGLSLSFCMSLGVAIALVNQQKVESFSTYDIVEPEDYYSSSLDLLSGDALLSALRSLNSTNRKDKVGYGSLPDYYKYTDYDPAYATTDASGITSGTRLLSFYSGNSAVYSGNMNREHVWPNTHGGSVVEGDIHMTRPTIIAENGSRGHSFYIEGMKHSQNGWDPAMEDFGEETYRGDAARIIFYCMVATDTLKLVDDPSRSSNTNNKEMGIISDMLNWNIRYPVQQREQNRNRGAQYLQGNRNPFIDHPEYACKIWANTNTKTQEICSINAPETITLNKTSLDLVIGDTYTLEVKSVTPSDASKSVTWSSSNSNIASVNSSGVVTANDKGTATIYATSTMDTNVKASVTINVSEPADVSLQSISLSLSTTKLAVGDTIKANVEVNPSNTYPKPTYSFTSSNTSVASVSSAGEIKGLSTGKTTIGVTATQSSTSISKQDSLEIEVVEANKYTKVTSSDDFVEGQYLIVCESANKMLNPNADSLDSQSNAKAVTISSNEIAQSDDTKQNEFSVLKSSSGYSFKTATNKYLTNSGKAVSLSGSETFLSVSFASGVSIKNGNNLLQYNTSWGGFRFYTSAQTAVSLFKKSGSATPEPPEDIHVTSVSLDKEELELGINEEETLVATVLPSNATNKSVTWSSSDDSIASVTNGVVKGLKVGTVTITVTTVDGNKVASCSVEVKEDTPTPPTPPTPEPQPNNDNNNTGIIIGLIAGGTVALGGIIALIVVLIIKKKSRNLIK